MPESSRMAEMRSRTRSYNSGNVSFGETQKGKTFILVDGKRTYSTSKKYAQVVERYSPFTSSKMLQELREKPKIAESFTRKDKSTVSYDGDIYKNTIISGGFAGDHGSVRRRFFTASCDVNYIYMGDEHAREYREVRSLDKSSVKDSATTLAGAWEKLVDIIHLMCLGTSGEYSVRVLQLTVKEVHDGSLVENSISVTQVPMREGAQREIHLFRGVDAVEKWNTMTGECVADYLVEHFSSQRAKAGAKKLSNKSYLLNKWAHAVPTLDITKGVTTLDIACLAKRLRFSMYAYSIDGTLVAQVSGREFAERGVVCYYISGSHFSPVTCREVIDSLVKKAQFANTAVSFVSDLEEKNKAVDDIHVCDGGSCCDGFVCKFAIESINDKTKRVITSEYPMEMICKDLFDKYSYLPCEVSTRDGQIKALRYVDTEITLCLDPTTAQEICTAFNIPFNGKQSEGALGMQVIQQLQGKMPMSQYSDETRAIIEAIHVPLAKKIFKRPSGDYGSTQAFDVKKCYSTILKTHQHPWPVFSAFDTVQAFSGVLQPSSEYYVTTRCTYPLNGDGWYPGCVLMECQDSGISFVPTKEWTPSLTLQSDYFKAFVEAAYSKLEEHTAKKMVNMTVGCMHKFFMAALRIGQVTRCQDVAVDCYHRADASDDAVGMIREWDGFFFTTSKMDVKAMSNNLPIHRVIIAQGWMQTFRLARGLGVMMNSNGLAHRGDVRLLGIKTDCVLVESSAKLENPDATKYKIEPFPNTDFFQYESSDVKHEYTPAPERVMEEMSEPDTDDFTQTASDIIDSKRGVMIQGFPGAGKSTLLKEIMRQLTKDKTKYIVVAPTNKAARNIGGKTIHRAFTMDLETKFRKSPNWMKGVEWIIVDEISMISSKMWSVLHGIHSKFKAKFILCGDPDQLSPVEVEDEMPGENMLDQWARAAYERAKKRTKRDFPDRKFDLTVTSLVEHAKRIKLVSEIDHSPLCYDTRQRNENAASLDRIDCSGGYTKDNIRIISKRQNVERGDKSAGEYDAGWTAYSSDYLTSNVVQEICEFRTMRMTKNRRSDPRMSQLLHKIREDIPVDYTPFFSDEIPRVNVAWTRQRCREVNAMLMEKYKGQDYIKIPASKGSEQIPLYLTTDSPLVCHTSCHKLSIFNGDMYHVVSMTNEDVMLRGCDNKVVTIQTKDIQSYFTSGFCITVHKAQGSTIREPFMIHEHSRLSKKLMYTALSRTSDVGLIRIHSSGPAKYSATDDVSTAKYLLSLPDEAIGELVDKELGGQFKTAVELASRIQKEREHCKQLVKTRASTEPRSRRKALVKYTETADLRTARYLLSLSYKELGNVLKKDMDTEFLAEVKFVGEKSAKARKKSKDHSKIVITQKYCRHVVKNNGTVSVSYGWAAGKSNGRLYGIGSKMQCMAESARGALLRNQDVYDVDMKNCHPVIARKFAQELGIETPTLDEYIANRDGFLKDNGLCKNDVLVALNKDAYARTEQPKLIAIDREFKCIQQAVWDNIEGFCRIPPKGYNPKGSYMNQYMCFKENELLQRAVKLFAHSDIHGLYFDGFMSRVMPDIAQLNQLTADVGVIWAIKPHSDHIQVPEDFV